MNQKIKAGSMRESINNIYTALIQDEELLRLLLYKPENRTEGRLHPLDENLKCIVPKENEDSDFYWSVIDERVLTATKSSNIEEEAICRIYIYPGRRRPKFQNYLIVDQEVVVDVFVHESYEGDLRTEWICDRINELLIHERHTNYGGLIEYAAGNNRVAPIGYTHYENIYVYGDRKK